MDVRVVEQVEVIQHKYDRRLDAHQLIDEDRNERVVRRRRSRQVGEDAGPAQRSLDCRDHVWPEDCGLAVRLIERKPRDSAIFL